MERASFLYTVTQATFRKILFCRLWWLTDSSCYALCALSVLAIYSPYRPIVHVDKIEAYKLRTSPKNASPVSETFNFQGYVVEQILLGNDRPIVRLDPRLGPGWLICRLGLG